MMGIFNLPIVYIALILAITIGIDIHHGYWIDSASKILKRSKGFLLIILRIVQAGFTFAFTYLSMDIAFSSSLNNLTSNPSSGMLISMVAAFVASIVIMLIIFRKDRGFSQMLALGLQEIKDDLIKTVSQETRNSISGVTNIHKEFLDTYDKRLETAVARCNDLSLDRDYLLEEILRFRDRFDSGAKTFDAALDRLGEKEEKTDLLQEEFRIEVESLRNLHSSLTQGLDDESPDTKITSEEGRINRKKGFEAQNELADTIRSWGLTARIGYNKGVPDFKVIKDGKLAVVIACKAFSLSEGGTKQRRIDRDDILAEFQYAKQKKVPLIIAVKNLITERWWMNWISTGDVGEFEGISTPVILGEDGNEAVSSLEESIKSAREKMQGVANA